MTPDKAAALFDQLAKTPLQGHDAAWLEFVDEVLRLPGCYLPAAQEILRQGAWRRHTGRGQNPIGYVKTATERAGLRMGLATDRYDRSEPRVPTKDLPQKSVPENRLDELRFDHADTGQGLIPLALPDGVTYSDHIDQLQSASSNAMPTLTSRGTWHLGSGERADDHAYHEIPVWLRRNGEYDAVNWEMVAKYAALKPRLVPSLARALQLRFEEQKGRPAAMREASSPREAREIEAAWKWIDRYMDTRIAPLFRLSEPPSPRKKTAVKSKFIPPAQALRSVLAAQLPRPVERNAPFGEALQKPYTLSVALDEICQHWGLSRDLVYLSWDGSRLSLRWDQGGGLDVAADTVGEALEVLQSIVFHQPAQDW